ncbi:MAG: type II toxin-antitoxin system PemK/MazF family toxin [Pirellulales bacterium]
MTVERGDVVLVSFPFSSLAGAKLRPAIVVQTDMNNARLASTILAGVSSRMGPSLQPTQVPIDPSTPDGALTGLLRPSLIKSENLATVETALIQRKIGRLSPQLVSALNEALKVSLGI